MWAVDNRTPYAADRLWTRNMLGRHEWVVCLKATFDIPTRGKQLTLADEQRPPLIEPEYRGEPGASSLVYEADLVGAKPGTDVIVNGMAHAPKGRPAKEVAVLLRVGPIDKLLNVIGERVFVDGAAGISPSSAIAFTTLPILYERTFGGADLSHSDKSRHRIDPRNPVGTGFAVSKSSLVGKPAPNVEYAKGGTPRPASFGAVASYWSPRLELAGTYDGAWIEKRKPLLPMDYDPRYLQCAPVDQQVRPHLVGGESVQLGNLTPDGALVFELPRIVPRFRTFFGRRVETKGGDLTSVIIEPEHARVMIVWNSVLEVAPSDVERLTRTVVEEVTP